MARRRKTCLFDDLFTLAILLPWWASLLVALVSWYLLHGYATSPIPPIDPHRPDVTGAIFRGLAMGFQYIVPFIFALGAVGSVAGRAKRKRLFKDVAEATQPAKTLDGISWREFELLVGEAFRRKGFSVTERGGNGPVSGVDLELHLGTDKYLVQCKQLKALKIGVAVIREFFGVTAAEGAAGGFAVSSGAYTKKARAFAQRRNIQRFDRTLLKQWFANRPMDSQSSLYLMCVMPRAYYFASICPLYSFSMIIRTARRGVGFGKNSFEALKADLPGRQ
ncbi:restriction endonuclease [Pseudomonas otitidis]|uniref:restriction endonuclease n=1 Tax=Metapseudomonas otitidis TaxID=319939 RepID=UPI0024AD225C|nr:restriction endonuclease [Pseudomonas otitidis]MDI6527190.1 restriction endonuclease [Pseudomonas otitidis]